MAFNPIENVVKCTVEQDFRGQQCLNTLYFLHSVGAVNVVDLTTLVGTLTSFWATEIMPNLSDDLGLLGVLARDLTTAIGLEMFGGSTGVTGGAGDAMPNNVAACVSIRTPFAGRHYRGRNFLGAIPRAVVSENSYDASFRTAITDAYNGIAGADNLAPNWTWVVVAQEEAGAPIPGGIVTEVTQAVFVDAVVDNQRRRLPGRGK